MKTTKELIIADITAKVEAKLASQKVNLSLVDDLIKKFEGVKTTEAKIISEIRKAGVIVDKGENDFKNLLKLLDTMEKDADVLLKQAKDLGININELTVYKDFLKAKDDLRLSSDKIQASWTLVSKY